MKFCEEDTIISKKELKKDNKKKEESSSIKLFFEILKAAIKRKFIFYKRNISSSLFEIFIPCLLIFIGFTFTKL